MKIKFFSNRLPSQHSAMFDSNLKGGGGGGEKKRGGGGWGESCLKWGLGKN